MGKLGKIIVATSFKKLPKVQKIAQSGHTDDEGEGGIIIRDERTNYEEEEPPRPWPNPSSQRFNFSFYFLGSFRRVNKGTFN